MRRLLLISLCTRFVVIVFSCKTSEKGGSSVKTNESVPADSLVIMTSDSLKRLEQLSDSLRQPPSNHNAPNQTEIDSLKNVKNQSQEKVWLKVKADVWSSSCLTLQHFKY